ncbi:MAG: IS607 family transposase [Desulfobacteraceae bacterium]|nr:IS607 family transposase [Desulfobacteraceae bacterium]
MKAKEVLKITGIRRETLSRLVKQQKIRAVKTPSGRYEYNDDDVLKYAGKTREHFNIIYARVSTQKQKTDLMNQVEKLETFCAAKGIKIDFVFKDIASGINYDNRKQFFELLDMVFDYKVSEIFITCKDRLSRGGFDLFRHLFQKFGCRITVINEAGSEKLDSEEIFEEITNLIHCFSMKHYSTRRINKVKEVLSEKKS